MNDRLGGLSLHLALLSLSAIGGGVILVAPDIHDYVAVRNHWLTSEQFSAAYALAQAAPGPNVLFVTLIGWLVAGWTGALVTTAAVILPSALLALGVARVAGARRLAQAGQDECGGVADCAGRARAQEGEQGEQGEAQGEAQGAAAWKAQAVRRRAARWPGRWSGALRSALAPLSAGMLAAAGWSFLGMSDAGALAILLALCAAAVMYVTKMNPVWLIATGALAGAAGVL